MNEGAIGRGDERERVQGTNAFRFRAMSRVCVCVCVLYVLMYACVCASWCIVLLDGCA